LDFKYSDYDDIEITGLYDSDYINVELDRYNYWIELSINKILEIPGDKGDIGEINSLDVHVKILRSKVIGTPKSPIVENKPQTNFEGKILTGRKLLVEGLLCETITYTADVEDQQIQSAQFGVPFATFIIVPDKFDGIDTKEVPFKINSLIEDVLIKKISQRKVFQNATVLIQGVPKLFESSYE